MKRVSESLAGGKLVDKKFILRSYYSDNVLNARF